MSFEISVRDFCNLLEDGLILVNESKSGVLNGIPYRIDPPGAAFAGQQKHIHIDDYTWNVDGSRSHESRWPSRAPSKRIKSVAAQMLGIDISLLESYYDYTVIAKPKNYDLAVLFESMEILGDPV
ncbi:MAG: hypothetical protein IJP51_00585 [Acidaminococcaceae bacterium]|nr:hypothetical protein [Acidaminococcaceae bacterium]